MSTKSNEFIAMEYSVNGKSLTFIKPQVMAIVNITPDSFYDGSKYSSVSDIVSDVEDKVRCGATIIDLGASSSRPGSVPVSEEEEWNRLEEPLDALRKEFPHIFISVDTFRSSVAKKAADTGADIINDISAGEMDKNMFQTVKELQLPYVMMHMKGTPKDMQNAPDYDNVSSEVKAYLRNKCSQLNEIGFRKIILDPGFGFGKNVSHNYSLLKDLMSVCDLGYPVLAGLSRKSMINKVIGTDPVSALNGTTVLNTIALLNGASILRVHDVTEAMQAIELTEYYKKS